MSSILNALWRVLFCTIAVSYFLCVLFLSGLQKEDLDVSLLVKLQRYNINDINNEELRRACAPENFSTPPSMTNDVKDTTLEVRGFIKDGNTTYSEVEKNIDAIKTDNRRTIEYTKGQPNIQSVMNFWTNMGKRSDAKGRSGSSIEVHKTRRAQELKSDLTKTFSNNLNVTEFMNNVISDKNQHHAIEIYKPIIPDKYNLNAERIVVDHKTEPIYFNVQPHFERNLAFKAYENVKYENNNVNKPTEQKIDDILKTINQFKSMFSNINPNKNDDMYKRYDTNKTVTRVSKVEEMNAPVSQNKLEPSQLNFTDELVKKIAQSVKDMVLQDLRKEMQITTTTTTHKVETISILQMDNLNHNENIMTKVMTMLQSLKQKQTLNVQEIKTKQPTHNYQVNNINKYDQPLKQADKNQYPTNNLTPLIHKFNTDPQNSKQTLSRPITFQTNSLEIPPLGIQIMHGLNPINQNIIVTTFAPFKSHYESDNGPSYSDSALMKVYPKEVLQSPLSAKFSKRSDDCPLNHPCDHKNEDVIRFRLSNEGKTKYDTDYYEKINLGRVKTNNEGYSPRAPRFHEKLERIDQFDLREMNEDCCRYPITQQMVECCNEKIRSRQQTSLIKKRGSYDDTHFRNFLKTQQKVTDMLEQILASKARDMPVSVETT
ncbi:uncharacterized protein LOC123718689 isoform X2 [Pieris brassicae]|uniref:uncharacterized protein LOC123718689 isoform X2 n=1 Tax=Pieris brassicae TaxID=7116 RepID=UPI001E65ED1E|nr:uncharacterized protein LOC123718689 isoform X2 [Pieris brassicae]